MLATSMPFKSKKTTTQEDIETNENKQDEYVIDRQIFNLDFLVLRKPERNVIKREVNMSILPTAQTTNNEATKKKLVAKTYLKI